jgi:hypothetical protein
MEDNIAKYPKIVKVINTTGLILLGITVVFRLLLIVLGVTIGYISEGTNGIINGLLGGTIILFGFTIIGLVISTIFLITGRIILYNISTTKKL